MRKAALEHVAEDLHVLVRMRPETLAGLDGVIVDHAQRPEPHLIGIVVVAERERVPGVEPVDLRMEPVCGFA